MNKSVNPCGLHRGISSLIQNDWFNFSEIQNVSISEQFSFWWFPFSSLIGQKRNSVGPICYNYWLLLSLKNCLKKEFWYQRYRKNLKLAHFSWNTYHFQLKFHRCHHNNSCWNHQNRLLKLHFEIKISQFWNFFEKKSEFFILKLCNFNQKR